MSIMYKLTEPLEVGIGESMPAEFIKEAERSRSRTVSLTDEIERLKTENAKLRELVRELWEGYADPPCEECPLKDKPACADCTICAREAAVVDRMRELGVEVEQ